MMAVRDSASSRVPRTSAASESERRHSAAIAPWPTAGRKTSGAKVSVMRSLQPRRSSPALARRMASYSPLWALRRRVLALPRTSRTSRSGRMWRSGGWRRRVPGPGGAPRRGLGGGAARAQRRPARSAWAPQDAGKGHRRGDWGRDVLDAVEGDGDRFFHRGVFEFLEENASAADLG